MKQVRQASVKQKEKLSHSLGGCHLVLDLVSNYKWRCVSITAEILIHFYMSVELKIRRHIAQTRPDPQLGETVINVQKKIELH